MNKEKLSKYIGKPIVETDNQHIRGWYYANVGDIPNQIDRSKSREEQTRQAYTRKGLSKEEAMEDIIQTASKTNADVNKEFGL